MNLNEYKKSAKLLMKLLTAKTEGWSKIATLGKVRKDYTAIKVYTDSNAAGLIFNNIKPFFAKYNCELIKRDACHITIRVKTEDLSKLAALYKIHSVK